ncbi:hypothetical protein BJF83_24130 [Nocardiopsis sp. CNR-923]|uniref:ATP-binding protein n=1 Tax=Nocardiopsis sp. CNR-923 TaxID=1904965 RepID=UPI00095B347D|nr:ATP-binding protein [Nocardiopsis sp. CNR-923]OLT24468.1 hypothetical protein BJF83_24130 [Nocardiopsis sp. CNR-923]
MFPGQVDEVAKARSFVRALLEGHPTAEDAELVVSELATNALLHTRSRGHRGMFTVRVRDFGDRVRISVVDYGSDDETPHIDPSGSCGTSIHGRGLFLVDQLAKEWGAVPEPVGTCVWADLPSFGKL